MIPTTVLVYEIIINSATKLVEDNLANPTKELVEDNLVKPTTELSDEILVNPAKELVDDNETTIGAVDTMVNLTKNISNIKFDEELLANDEWL